LITPDFCVGAGRAAAKTNADCNSKPTAPRPPIVIRRNKPVIVICIFFLSRAAVSGERKNGWRLGVFDDALAERAEVAK